MILIASWSQAGVPPQYYRKQFLLPNLTDFKNANHLRSKLIARSINPIKKIRKEEIVLPFLFRCYDHNRFNN